MEAVDVFPHREPHTDHEIFHLFISPSAAFLVIELRRPSSSEIHLVVRAVRRMLRVSSVSANSISLALPASAWPVSEQPCFAACRIEQARDFVKGLGDHHHMMMIGERQPVFAFQSACEFGEAAGSRSDRSRGDRPRCLNASYRQSGAQGSSENRPLQAGKGRRRDLRLVWVPSGESAPRRAKQTRMKIPSWGSNGIFGGSTMAGAGLILLAILAVLALGIPALIKYPRS